MILIISAVGKDCQKLSYLLQKSPFVVGEFDVGASFKTYVFFPEYSEERTTCAVMFDMNSIELVKSLKAHDRHATYSLFDYINDRPYVSSSFTCSIISDVFRSALNGKCREYPDLPNQEFDLSARFYVSMKTKDDLIKELFEPLGYELSYSTERPPVDSMYEQFGESPYYDVTISRRETVKDLLSHLYILIPILDKMRHYGPSSDEVKKIMKIGDSWLKDHPSKKKIVGRYFGKKKELATSVLDRLEDQIKDEQRIDENSDDEKETRTPLAGQRRKAIIRTLREHNVKTVLDLGCSTGKLSFELIDTPGIVKVTGADISARAIEKAVLEKRIHKKMTEDQKSRLDFVIASAIYRDLRFSAFDAIVLQEVIEHFDSWKLRVAEDVVFKYSGPRVVVVTTPNIEYNVLFENLENGKLRHRDHKFEFTRGQFKEWANRICKQFGYTVSFEDIGEFVENIGTQTQMAVFVRNNTDDENVPCQSMIENDDSKEVEEDAD